MAHGVAGQRPARPVSRGRRIAGNVLTALLVLAALVLLLRRFGLLRR